MIVRGTLIVIFAVILTVIGKMPDEKHYGSGEMAPFKAQDQDTCVPAWQDYKREFRVRLQAAGLDTAPGKRQVGQLLKSMGIECIKLFDSFEFAPAVEAVEADAARGIAAVPARDAESKDDLDTVLGKFDAHWGVNRFKSIKRQEFLDLERRDGQTIMDFIAEVKRKAEYCEFAGIKDDFICDKITNKIKDEKCSERLLELPDSERTLARVIEVCRQVEVTKTHLKSLGGGAETTNTNTVKHVRSDDKKTRAHWRRGRGGSSRGYSQRNGQRWSSAQQQREGVCQKCLRTHGDGECRATHARCNTCNEIGHFARSPLCRMKDRTQRRGGRGYRGHRGYDSGRGSHYESRPHYGRGRGYGRSNRGRGRSVH